jgi:hypothetical protein
MDTVRALERIGAMYEYIPERHCCVLDRVILAPVRSSGTVLGLATCSFGNRERGRQVMPASVRAVMQEGFLPRDDRVQQRDSAAIGTRVDAKTGSAGTA